MSAEHFLDYLTTIAKAIGSHRVACFLDRDRDPLKLPDSIPEDSLVCVYWPTAKRGYWEFTLLDTETPEDYSQVTVKVYVWEVFKHLPNYESSFEVARSITAIPSAEVTDRSRGF